MHAISLNNQILLGVVTGALLGFWLAALEQQSVIVQSGLYIAKLAGTLFTDLLRMVLIPLVLHRLLLAWPIYVPIEK